MENLITNTDRVVASAAAPSPAPTLSSAFPEELKRQNSEGGLFGSVSTQTVVSGVAGGILMMFGRKRRGLTGTLLTAVGGMLVTNAVAGTKLAGLVRT